MNQTEVVVTIFTPFDAANRVDHGALRESAAYYRECGVDGLFANCQTSETLRLSEAEQRSTVETLTGASSDMTLYSGINLGADIKTQAWALNAIRDCGADIPVVWLSTLPSEDSMDEQLLQLAEMASGSLGIYECPDPVHRLLDDASLTKIAQSGRYTFFKDTCRDNTAFARRMHLIEGSALKSYQANWKCLPHSIEDGAAGFSGWLAAARPDAVVAYSKNGMDADTRSSLHEALFDLQEAMRAANYPASGKYLLKRRGLDFEPSQRNTGGGLSAIDASKIDALEKADEQVDACLSGIVA